MLSLDRQAESHSGSHPFLTFDLDFAVVIHDDLMEHGQSQAWPPGFGGEKWVIDRTYVFSGDALAGIKDFDQDVIVDSAASDPIPQQEILPAKWPGL